MRWTSIPSGAGGNTDSLSGNDNLRQHILDVTYLLTLFLFNAHFHKAPTVAARSSLSSEDLDVII